MKNLFTDIQKRLLATVPLLKYVDEDWGQIDSYGPNMPVKWPCALIDMGAASWTDEADHLQIGIVQVRIRVANMRLSNSSGAAPQNQKDKAFAIYDLLDEVHRHLHGWCGSPDYGSLTRTSWRRIQRNDGIKEFEMIYTVQQNDDAAVPRPGKTRATVKIVM